MTIKSIVEDQHAQFGFTFNREAFARATALYIREPQSAGGLKPAGSKGFTFDALNAQHAFAA